MSSLQPEAESIAATGQRCSTISPRVATSANLIGLVNAVLSLPRDRAGASGVTSATPRTKARPAGTGAGAVMGSDSAPRSSRSATTSSHSMRAIRLWGRGQSCRATKCAVAVSHPRSAANISSTGCGASSAPPEMTGVSEEIAKPVDVLNSHPALPTLNPERPYLLR